MVHPLQSILRSAVAATAALVLLSVVAAHAVFANVPPSHYAVVLATLDKYVVPQFVALRDAADPLPNAIESLCQHGDDARQEAAISVFRNTVKAWAAVDFLRFGPMTEGARRERMSFWPDPRGVMKRQLRAMVAAEDEAVVAGDAIAKQSAAVQGLPALEVLLVDKTVPLGPQAQARYRCKLAHAIATNVKAIADGLLNDWTKEGGWRDRMLRPGSDNPTYKEPQEAASELAKAFLTGLALIGDGEVKPQLDKTAKYNPPYEKAEASRAFFIAGVRSLSGLYEAMNLEAFLAEDKYWVINWTGGAWRTLKESDGAGGGVSGVKKARAPPLQKVQGMFSGLRKLTTAELLPAAGLTVGFNELDGD